MKKWKNAELIQLSIRNTASGSLNDKVEVENANPNAYAHADENSALFGTPASATTSDNTDLTNSES